MEHLKTYESFFSRLFKRSSEVVIRKMKKSDVDKCLDIKYQYFGHFYGDTAKPSTKEKHNNYIYRNLDLSVSIVAEKDGKIIGGYFLKSTGLPNFIGNFYDFSNSDIKGIEGVSLFVHPDYKSEGIGHLLKYYYKNNNSDYHFIWGQAYHGLDNMKHWLKNRTLFNDMCDVYFTIEFYKGSVNDYPKTKYLDFYNKNNKSVVDHIAEELGKGLKPEQIIGELNSQYQFDLSLDEINDIMNYIKE